MTRPFSGKRRLFILFLAFALLSVPLSAEEPVFLPLRIDVEGWPLESPDDVVFYGSRVPRVHYQGFQRISEREFFAIVGDSDAELRARNHRAVNTGLGVISIVAFFAGLVLFGAADDVDYGAIGMTDETNGRIISIGLTAGSLVPALAVTVRGQQSETLEYAYRSMVDYNRD